MEEDPFRDDAFSYKTKVKCVSRCRQTIRLMDLYALPITLRYKNEKKFFTNFGAMTSLFIILGMISLMYSGIITMLAHTEIVQNTSNKLISQKPAVLETRGGTFMFGYRIIDAAGEVF